MSTPTQCPCGKNKLFTQCCGRYLSSKQHAKTAEQLMRSRYCAYALGGYGKYLLETWHPLMTERLTIESLSQKQHEWVQLEIINKTQTGDSATVEFNAHYITPENEQCVLHENSYFQRIKGRWLYVGANIEKRVRA